MPKIIINGKVYNKDVLDIKDKIVSFNDSNNREKNINSKESISTLISRIKKWLYDLHEVAYSGSYNDLSNKPTIPSAVRVKGNRETAYRAGDVNLTVGNIGAVPDYNSTIIGPNVDWNTIIAVGAHRIEGATMDEAHHAPVNVHNYGIVYVLLDSSNGRLAQIYTPHATGGTQQIQYPIFTIRWRSGSSWGGWIPTYGRTFNDSRYLLKAGDTMTGNLVLNKDETVNGIATFKRSTGQGVYKGANGTSGWVVFAQIKISVAYRNFTIEFEVGGRARTLGTILGVMFGNVSSTDPALSEFVYYGGPGNIFRLKKTATSTWQLAAQKSEMYGEIYVMRVHSEYDFLHDGSIIITYPNTQLTSVDGWTAPTLGGNIGYAANAGTVGGTGIANLVKTINQSSVENVNKINNPTQFLGLENAAFSDITGFGSFFHIIHLHNYHTNGYASQILFPFQNTITDTDMFIRTANDNTWRTPRRVVHDGNISEIAGLKLIDTTITPESGLNLGSYDNAFNNLFGRTVNTACVLISQKQYNSQSAILYFESIRNDGFQIDFGGNGLSASVWGNNDFTSRDIFDMTSYSNKTGLWNYFNVYANSAIKCLKAKKPGETVTYIPIMASAFTVSSSLRYKKDIFDMTEQEAQKILLINVKSYHLNNESNNDKLHYGMIAEQAAELELEHPLMRDEEGRPEALDYSAFVPYLTKMIQMQQKEISMLKNEVNELKMLINNNLS